MRRPDERERATPGWDDLDAALLTALGGSGAGGVGAAPRLFGVESGEAVLAGVGAVALGGEGPGASPGGDPPAWLLVTYGLSELFEKDPQAHPDLSGLGLELTARVPRSATEPDPPGWALALLEDLAAYALGEGAAFGPGHLLDLHGPLADELGADELGADELGAAAALAQDPGPTAGIEALTFRFDPLLPPRRTANGALAFVQLIGLTRDELRAARAWDPQRLVERFAEREPLGLLDPARPSHLSDPALRGEVEARTAAEGSSRAFVLVPSLDWEQTDDGECHVRVEADDVEALRLILAGRTLHGRDAVAEGPGEPVLVRPDPEDRWEVGEEGLLLDLSPETARALLADVKAAPGVHRWPALPGLELRVEP